MIRLLLALALLLAACEPPMDVEPLPCRNVLPGTAELGIGNLATGFQPRDDDAEVYVEFGPQGMHMLIVSVRALDLEKPSVGGGGNRLRIGIRHDGYVVGGTVSEVQPQVIDERTSDFLGLRPIFTVAEIDELVGEDIYVEAIVTDGCGREIKTGQTWSLLQ